MQGWVAYWNAGLLNLKAVTSSISLASQTPFPLTIFAHTLTCTRVQKEGRKKERRREKAVFWTLWNVSGQRCM